MMREKEITDIVELINLGCDYEIKEAPLIKCFEIILEEDGEEFVLTLDIEEFELFTKLLTGVSYDA